jgi:hypothetical protein
MTRDVAKFGDEPDREAVGFPEMSGYRTLQKYVLCPPEGHKRHMPKLWAQNGAIA